jgi:hypothetical protein
LVSRKKRRKLSVRNTSRWKAKQKRGCHEHDPDARLCQSPINFAKERRSKRNVLFAEPDGYAARFELIVEFRGIFQPVGPRMAQEDITKIR